MVFCFGVGALLLALRPAAGAVFDPDRQWETLATPHFAIHHTKEDEAIAQKVALHAEEAFEKLTRKLDNIPWGRIQVILVDQNETANGFATVIPYNVIVLRLASPDADSTLGSYDDWLKTLVTHELTHIVHMTTTGYPAKGFKFLFGKLVSPNGLEPGWITEGLATFEETVETAGGRGRASTTDMVLRTDILNHQFLPIDKGAGSYPDWPAWRASYLYGVGFMQFLAGRYGEESLTRFSHSYGSTLWFYSLNHHAKKAFGKSFKVLWKEWEEELRDRFEKEKARLEKEGLVEPVPLVRRPDLLTAPTPLPAGGGLLFSQESIHRPSEIRRFDPETGRDERILRWYAPSSLSVDKSGEKVVFAATRTTKRYYNFSDLFLYDLKKGALTRLTVGARATDPDISPDGSTIALVQSEQGTSNLFVRAIDGGQPRQLTAFKEFEVVGHPRWSPDGKSIAATIWKRGEGRDLYLLDPSGKEIPVRLTHDRRQVLHPWWSPDGRSLYVSSDRTGIFNIWRIDRVTRRMTRVTNVLSGVFHPALSVDGRHLYMQYYNGRGYEIRELAMGGKDGARDVSPSAGLTRSHCSGRRGVDPRCSAQRARPASPPPAAPERVPDRSRHADFETSPAPSFNVRPYRPGTTLLPHYIQPMVFFLDNTILLLASAGSQDPLARHGWYASGNFRSDNNYFGAGAGYAYSRYVPTFYLGAARYAVKFGSGFSFSNPGESFFEERHRGYGGASFPLYKLTMNTSYFFEDRRVLSGVQSALIGTSLGPPVGRFAGLDLSLGRRTTRSYPASTDPERGYSATVNFEVTDTRVGSDENLEQRIAWTDLRYFVPLPADHHVLAFRLAGGAAFGDRLLQGNFVVGGSLGEGLLAGVPGRNFSLRGLPFGSFSRDRAFIFSSEYRIPLFRLNRGISTLPLFLNSGSMALFADVGNAWNFQPAFADIVEKTMVGIGMELRGDFTISYGVPLKGRLGYGIIVTARDRITLLNDDLTGEDAEYGTIILQLGTSF